jgi:hypothetical protein
VERKENRNYYTMAQVKKILGISNDALYNYVENGALERVIPPGKKQGLYIRSQVDQLARDLQVFLSTRDESKTTFRKAEKADMPACMEVFMTSNPRVQQQRLTPSENVLETRLSWLDKNPDLFYVVEHDGEIVGFTSMIPLKPEKIKEILDSSDLIMNITPDEIDEFKPGKPLHVYIATMRTKPNISRLQKRSYGVRLIGGLISTIIDMLENDVNICAFYARSEAVDGIRVLRHMGFTQIPSVTDSKNYILEMDKGGRTTLEKYRHFFRER